MIEPWRLNLHYLIIAVYCRAGFESVWSCVFTFSPMTFLECGREINSGKAAPDPESDKRVFNTL